MPGEHAEQGLSESLNGKLRRLKTCEAVEML
jgi:hypothetical protein